MAKPCKDCEKKADNSMALGFGRARFQPDGSVIYPKKGNEPPPDLDGFERDPGNAWRFKPLWKSCAHRMQNQYLKSCGALGIISFCTHPDGPTDNQREVDYDVCSQCPLMKTK